MTITKNHRKAHTMRTPTLVSLTALLAAALLLSGCSAEAEPEPIFAEPEPSASPSPIATQERDSAEAYIRRWNDAQTAMYSGSVDEYLTVYRDCDVCTRTGERVRGYFAAGGYVETEGREIVSVERDFRRGKQVHFLVETLGSPTEFAEKAGGAVQTLSGGPATFRMTLSKESGRWNLLTYVELAQ